ACQGNFKLLRHYHDGPTGAYYVKAGEESFLNIGLETVFENPAAQIPQPVYQKLDASLKKWEKLESLRDEVYAATNGQYKPLKEEPQYSDLQAHPSRVNDTFWSPLKEAGQATLPGHPQQMKNDERRLKKQLSLLRKAIGRLSAAFNDLQNSKRWRLSNPLKYLYYSIQKPKQRGIPYRPVDQAMLSVNQRLANVLGLAKASFEKKCTPTDPHVDSSIRKQMSTAIAAWDATTNLAMNDRSCLIGFLVIDCRQQSDLKRTIDSLPGGYAQHWQVLVLDHSSHDQGIPLANRATTEGQHKVDQLIRSCQFVMTIRSGDMIPESLIPALVQFFESHRQASILFGYEGRIENRSLSWVTGPDWDDDLFWSSPGLFRAYLIAGHLLDAPEKVQALCEGLIESLLLDFRQLGILPTFMHTPVLISHGAPKWTESYSEELRRKIQRAVTAHDWIPCQVNAAEIPRCFRVCRAILDREKVSIIIPVRDRVEMLRNCVTSIRSFTSYENYEILVIDNDSEKDETRQYLDRSDLRVIPFPGKFNYAAINNLAAQHARGRWLLFLNNDTLTCDPQWLSAMVEHGQRPDVGAVGARLHYGDFSLQHGGVTVRGRYGATHLWPRIMSVYQSKLTLAGLIRQCSAVTAACMLTPRDLFLEMGGLDEHKFAVSFNDVDYCLRLRASGKKVIYTPYASLLHLESVSRGRVDSPQEVERLLELTMSKHPYDPFLPELQIEP
ncbi:MAG: glycosyltransferase family 2 protein, partial [Verrucomicrobiales bacterium]